MAYDTWKIREDFPMLEKRSADGAQIIYLDNAATTYKPQSVIDTISNFYANEYASIHRGIYESATLAAEKYAHVRDQVATYIGAKSSDEIVFVRSTTEGINLLAHTFPRAFMSEGDEIIISELEHHANIVPWQMVAKERGLILKVVPIKSGTYDIEAFRNLLTERTKLVSVGHITNVTGDLNPVEEIIALAHAKGAKVLIDGAQAAGHLDINVQKINADFYVFSGHKMYGPTGIGILYGKYELLDALPPYQSGGDMIESVSLTESTFQKPPMRFEPGTPLISGVMGLGEAINYVESVGLENIHAWEKYLVDIAQAKLSKVPGLKILGNEEGEKGAIVTFIIDGCHPLDVATLLNLRGIAVRSGLLCAEPAIRAMGYDSVIRASFGLYTIPEEIEALANALQDSLAVL
jgi:cysteine desulfurase / selenocysteine lyase